MDVTPIRVNLHGTSDAENGKLLEKVLVNYQTMHQIIILILLLKIMEGFSDADLLDGSTSLVNKKNCGTLPDFGTFVFQENGAAVIMDVKMNLINTKELKNLCSKHLQLVQNLMCLMKMEMRKK